MKTRIFESLYAMFAPNLEPHVRAGSIKAVKTYINGVRLARQAMIRAYLIGISTAVLVAGFCVLVFGILGLLPVDPFVVSIVMTSIGGVITLLGAIALYITFSERRWLEASKSYELMEAVMAPWPNSIPPNLYAILKSERGESDRVEETLPVVPALVSPEPMNIVPPVITAPLQGSVTPSEVRERVLRREELVPQMLH